MTRASRLLTLAYRAHQRDEHEIAARIAVMAFGQDDAAPLFERINANNTNSPGTSDPVAQAEAMLRQAEASTEGSIFTVEGSAELLAIAEKCHKAGLPKIAKSIAAVAS